MKKTAILCLALLVSLVLALPTLAEDTSIPQELTWALSDDGTEVTISLLGNATTGFEWRCAITQGANLQLRATDYVAGGSTLAGAGGTATFTLGVADAATGDAEYVVRFAYARSWELYDITVYDVTLATTGGTLSVEKIDRLLPTYAEGDLYTCPECGAENAVVTEVVTGGDEEVGVTYFLTIDCPNDGILEGIIPD